MDKEEYHLDAEKALTKAWYAAIFDLYHTVSISENTADRIKAAECILDYTTKLGQTINSPFIPRMAEPEDGFEEEEEDDD